ncbi:DUF5677 domain-containing protein [Nocardia mangyaensis]|uniref:DUF5677 domain-containing protein n=1 Tax=Nocardia mangyaensis TaxID=2213200 RepID=UPI00267465E0|nr:DUF5677 domain-containing protein [Nocardia mangyaensis]MDO3648672.1 DUF5677 domain-containing protein [Nocardia mangyaensis]
MLSENGRAQLLSSRNLIASFDGVLDEEELRLRPRSGEALSQPAMVLGLAVHTHRLGALILDLIERETAVALVLPTLRACYEAALTAHWIAQSKNVAFAMFNEELRQRRGLQRSVRESISLNEIVEAIAHADEEYLSGNALTSKEQAQFIEQRLKDFDVGAEAYAYYRLLCGYTHAGASVVDQYLEEAAEGDAGAFTLLTEPSEAIPADAIVALTGCCLIWAGSAVRYISDDRIRRRQELRDAAAEFGIVPDLRLSFAAQDRQGRSR